MSKNTKPWIGIDLGGTNIQAGLINRTGKILTRYHTKTKVEQGADAVVKRILKLARNVVEEAGLDMQDVAGLGIGAPGTIDRTNGIVQKAVNLRWTNFPLAKRLHQELQIPILLDNDVNVGTWGEYRAGAGQGHDHMLGVFIGTGIGGGLIIDGKIYHGILGTAGELGHAVVEPHASLGRRTLENLASRTSIVNLLTQLIRSNHPSCLPELTGGDLSKIRSKVLAAALDRKDPLTEQVLTEAARYIGISIAGVVTLLSLPCVVIGGGLSAAVGKQWVQRIREAFEEHVFPTDLRSCSIVTSSLGDDAGIIGAALLAQTAAEESPN